MAGTIREGEFDIPVARDADFEARYTGQLAALRPKLDEIFPDQPTYGLKPDSWIRMMARKQSMISDFQEHTSGNGIISYGLSSYGYDMRVSNQFKIFNASTGRLTVVDPKRYDKDSMIDYECDPRGVCVIPPNSFALATSIERFRMPTNVLGLCLGKSTYARAGIVTNFTPFEPGWEGQVTIEISNTTPLPAIIYAGEGIAQVLFFEAQACEVDYATRKGGGKYQGQTGIVTAKVW